MPSFGKKGKKGKKGQAAPQPEPEPEPEPEPQPEPEPPPAHEATVAGREQAPRETTMAVWDNDAQAVRALVVGRRAASAYEDPADGTSLLLLACQNKYEDIAVYLIAQGAEVNACWDSDRTSPLVHATRGGCIDTVEALLDHGADPEHECANGLTALGVATQRGDGELMQVLLAAGASRDGGQPSPLAVATASYDEAVASNDDAADGERAPTPPLVLLLGRAIPLGLTLAPTPWLCPVAVWQELLAMLEQVDAAPDDLRAAGLLDADEDVQGLLDAVTECDLGRLEQLLLHLSSGASLGRSVEELVNDPFDSEGTTLLWQACQLGHEPIVARLIAAGADVNGVACGESTRESRHTYRHLLENHS